MAWRRMRSGHYSSQILLAYADGELPRRTAKKVQLHLEACWECRARLTDLDNEAQEVARRSAHQTFPSPARVAKARNDFFSRVSEHEQRSAELATEFASVAPLRARAVWTVAGTVVLCAVTVAFWLVKHQPDPKARDLLVAANESERAFYQRGLPVYQTFQVQIEANQPPSFTRTSRLEVWSEGRGQRFALRWKDRQGHLKLGSWRPHRKRLYVYDSARSEQARPEEDAPREPFSLADFSEYDARAEALEVGFIRWIRSRSWQPISLAHEMSLFCSEDGVVLRAARVFSDARGQILRLSAQRLASGRRIELVLEIDPLTYRPILAKVRLQAGHREAELRITLARAEYVKASRVVFEPDIPVARPRWNDAPPGSAREVVPQAAPQGIRTDPAALESTEVRLRYVLHQLGACLGEPVEIVRQASAIYLRGVVKNTARKQQLLSHLAAFHDSPNVTLDIRTVEEVLHDQSRSVSSTGDSTPAAPWEAARRFSTTVTHVAATQLAIQNELEEYFESQSTGSPSPKADSANTRRGSRVTRFCNESLSLWQTAFKHSWALRRLLDRYAMSDLGSLEPASRRMLERMVRDHIVKVEQQADQVRYLVEPVLSSIVHSASPLGVGSQTIPIPQRLNSQDRADDSGWAALGLRLFARTAQIDRLIHGLLAGDVLPARSNAVGKDAVPGDQRSPNGAISDLLAEFSGLKDELSDFDARVAREFSVNPGLASSNLQSR